MTKRTPLGLVAAAAMAAVISAPAVATGEPDADTSMAVDLIEGLTWSLQRQAVDGALVELPDGVTITLQMESGSATGNGGCNGYFGSYVRDGDSLTFSDIGATEMYCPTTSELEAAYLADLAAVTSGFSTGGTLVMTGADGEPILEFAPADSEPIPADGLEGLAWQLDAIVLPGTSEPAPVPVDVVSTIELADGQASGNGGCNGFSAAYDLDGAVLAFDIVISTKMACPEPAMAVENALFTQLDAVAGWYSDGGSLTFVGADGQVLAHFVPVTVE